MRPLGEETFQNNNVCHKKIRFVNVHIFAKSSELRLIQN